MQNPYEHPPRPHVSIPVGARAPVNPSPSARTSNRNSRLSAYDFEVTPPAYPTRYPINQFPEHLSNPWDNVVYTQMPSPESPTTSRQRAISMIDIAVRPPSRSSTTNLSGAPSTMAFPEPQIFRSASQRSSLYPESGQPGHRPSRSDLGLPASALRLQKDPSSTSLASTISSYYPNDDSDNFEAESINETDEISSELSNLSLDSAEGLRRFQTGELQDSDQEWYRLVPPEARDALGKQEVQRQSVIFEVFKAEREYVFDLEAVQQVFVDPLRNASPPIIKESLLEGFICQVFGNLNEILAHHQRMLGALFERQRDQHPLVQSVADIILDTTLKSDFRSAYETYIKHYPLAESHHRQELKRNPSYQTFIHSAANDPRIRKRDLITFLSRPVTRLPRLNLLLEQILKLTDKEYEHPDLETLPIILGILSDCIKSTQPGIEAAESKVKFWALCESLVYQKGEIVDMDLYDESRTLVYSGSVSRRTRAEAGWSGWTELNVSLLDNFVILTREQTNQHSTVKRHITSRPLPLSYLRLGSFTEPPESRKERADDGRLLESLRYRSVALYPFTIYHASSKTNRRYTLYVASEALRKKWHSALVDAIGVHKVRQESNMWFDPQTINDSFFRTPGNRIASVTGRFTGKITSAVPFMSGGRKFIAVGCPSGVYVALRGDSNFHKVLNYSNPTSMAAIESLGNKVFNKFIIHIDSSLFSYSLDLLARVSLGQAQSKTLEASSEKITGQDSVLFFRHAQIGQRILIIYASKKLLQTYLHVLEAVDISSGNLTPRRNSMISLSFRPYGDPGYIPKDAYDVIPLVKTIAVSTNDGIVIMDPTNLARSQVNLVPDFSNSNTNSPLANLKSHVEAAKPLGLIRCDASELMVIYDRMGCYISKHGAPTRSSGYLKWESVATSYAHHGPHFLLFSPQFIEIRNTITGRLVQVIETVDARLLHYNSRGNTDLTILAAIKGDKEDKDGNSDKIIELVETSEITSTPTAVPAMWDEWDM